MSPRAASPSCSSSTARCSPRGRLGSRRCPIASAPTTGALGLALLAPRSRRSWCDADRRPAAAGPLEPDLLSVLRAALMAASCYRRLRAASPRWPSGCSPWALCQLDAGSCDERPGRRDRAPHAPTDPVVAARRVLVRRASPVPRSARWPPRSSVAPLPHLAFAAVLFGIPGLLAIRPLLRNDDDADAHAPALTLRRLPRGSRCWAWPVSSA